MTSGAAAAAAIAQAIKASGAIVRVKPEDFRKLAHQNPEALVVHAKGGWMWRRHKYLMGYRGLIFQANAAEPISLPHTCQLIEARRIWVP